MEIAIIGGGIVGLALALNLQQRGLRIENEESCFFNRFTQEELRALSDRYKRIAGYSIEALASSRAQSAT